MKVKDPETEKIEYTKIKPDTDGGPYIVEIDGQEYNAADFIMAGYTFIEISREEMADFNEFMDYVNFRLWDTEEYFQGKVDGYFEAVNKDKDKEEDGDENENEEEKDD